VTPFGNPKIILELAAFVEMVVFLGILLVGLGYAWRKGVLRWE